MPLGPHTDEHRPDQPKDGWSDDSSLNLANKSDSRPVVQEVLADMYQYQRELERLNTELAASRAHYFDLYEFAPVGYATLDDQGAILEMNSRAAGFFGIARDDFDPHSFSRYVLPEDQDVYSLYRKRLLESGLTQACEVRMSRRNAAPFWARLEMVQGHTEACPLCRIIVVDISDRKIAELKSQENEERLERSLSAKTTLIREAHHRVKNNLQVISSLLRMQAELIKDQSASIALNQTYMRILSMSLIHERLCANGHLDLVDFGEYTEALIKELFHSYTDSSDRITSCLRIQPVILNVDQAIPCGLMLNELVTNALKYAYPNDAKGQVFIELRETESGFVTLAVSDYGIGLPDGLDWRNSTSLGLPIVDILAKQIGGELIVRTRPGSSFTIEFSKTALSSAATA